MNDPFERKVQAAAVAGWWVILVGMGLLLVQWLIYLAIMSSRPEGWLALVGPDVTWAFVQNLWLWFMAIWKVCIWLMALVVLWLTLWARELRKANRE